MAFWNSRKKYIYEWNSTNWKFNFSLTFINEKCKQSLLLTQYIQWYSKIIILEWKNAILKFIFYEQKKIVMILHIYGKKNENVFSKSGIF